MEVISPFSRLAAAASTSPQNVARRGDKLLIILHEADFVRNTKTYTDTHKNLEGGARQLYITITNPKNIVYKPPQLWLVFTYTVSYHTLGGRSRWCKPQ